MSEIRRWSQTTNDTDGGPAHGQNPNGGWVLASDHDAEVERLMKQIKPAHNGALPVVLKSEHDAEVERLKASVTDMRHANQLHEDNAKTMEAKLESLRAINRELVEALEQVDAKAEAGLCQFTVGGKHAFLQDIRRQISERGINGGLVVIDKGAKG